MGHAKRVLVAGATGYIGGRLVPRLLEEGHEVRVLARSSHKLTDVPWLADVEVVEGDLLNPDDVARACDGIDVVVYLVHSLSASGSFEDVELETANNLATAARASGVKRIVYLGGLHPDTETLSRHLRSRAAVGDIFLNSGVPTVALQAGIVIGSGSASFEMIRHLTEVLPYMPAPKWVRNFVQPISVRDVLHYLVGAVALDEDVNRTFDVGGPDILRYGQMMNGYAVEAGLAQRPIASLPVFTPWLASQWVNLVTPIPRRLAVPIIESLQYDCVVQEHDIEKLIPAPAGGLTGYRQAVRLALARVKAGEVETSWNNASVSDAPSDSLPSDPDWAGHTVLVDERSRTTNAATADLWAVIEGIGGDNGWYSFALAWAIRGWLDKLVGGVGLRRGRRHTSTLQTGDALDFWRVESIDRGKSLRLRAEMLVPGRAWLELETRDAGDHRVYHQRAVFFPQGLGGRLYWYCLVPFHGIIFSGMANRIVLEAEQNTRLAQRSQTEKTAAPSAQKRSAEKPSVEKRSAQK